jgi:hypothetical protein
MAADASAKDVGPLAAAGPRLRSPADDFAIVIGIDHYPAFRPLQGAVADATAFRDWLCDPGGGGLAGHRIKLVTSSPTPSPLQKHVDDALEQLIEDADQNGGGRRLYFYFSGHGMAATNAIANVALLLADWSKKRARLGLSSQSYTNDLASYGLFEEVAVFLDCCRTESMPVVGMDCTLMPSVTTRKIATRNFVAYATEAGQSAFERPDSELWQGVFTRCLLGILKRTQAGVLAEELKDLLESELSGSLPPLHVTFSPATVGVVKLFDGFNYLVAELDPAAGVWRQPLRAGLYRMVDAAGRVLLLQHPTEHPIVY